MIQRFASYKETDPDDATILQTLDFSHLALPDLANSIVYRFAYMDLTINLLLLLCVSVCVCVCVC